MATQPIEYQDEGKIFEGYLAYDDRASGKRPTIIIMHDWRGRHPFVCKKADDLAKLGYVGFALDLFGKNILGHTTEERSKLMKPFVDDRALLRRRLLLALEVIKKQEKVDTQRIAAMGFCFGGLCALDLARSGAEIKGAISFHGILNAPHLPKEKIKAKILALHGHDDPMVPPDQVLQFQQEMTDAKVDWQMHIYGNTMHAFTNPEAHDPGFGTVYNSLAEKRSWQSLLNFLQEIFI